MCVLIALAGCAPAASTLQVRSAEKLGCRPARELKVSGHQLGDPRQNLPERWNVAGCGGDYNCSSFLMTTGRPAHTKCVEAQRSVASRRGKTDAELREISTRLRRTSAQHVADMTRCSLDRIQITGKMVEGTAHIYMVSACGQTYRCLTLGAGSKQESPTQCEELASEH